MRIATVLLMLVFSPSLAVCAEVVPEKTFAQSSSIFRVRAQNPNGMVNYGSAVLVQPGKLVTNCHVTRDARQIRVMRGSAVWGVESQFRDVEHDLCILAVPDVVGEIPDLAQASELKVGETVYARGYQGGSHLTLSNGEVVALHPFDGARIIQTSASFTFGESGGGLFDDQGRLVGIITFKARAGGIFHFALPVEWIRAVLAAADSKVAQASPEADRAFWERPSEGQPYFMQAATFESEKNWSRLLVIAQGWIAADTRNAGAWGAKSKALHYLNHEFEAASALREAVRLDPSYTQNDPQLELTYDGSGTSDQVLNIRTSLNSAQQ
jgi:hypothetical protein